MPEREELTVAESRYNCHELYCTRYSAGSVVASTNCDRGIPQAIKIPCCNADIAIRLFGTRLLISMISIFTS